MSKSKTPQVERTLKAAHVIARQYPDALVRADETPLTLIGAEDLSLIGIKTLGLMLKIPGGDIWKDKIWSVTREDIRHLTGNNLTNSQFESLCDNFAKIAFKRHETGKRNRLILRRRPVFKIMDNEESNSLDDRIEFAFSSDMRATLARSTHYTVLDLAVLAAMRSKYSIALYELGKRISRMPNFTWEGTPNELRAEVGVPEKKLTRMTDLKRYVLKPALDDINTLADFNMVIEEIRKGLRIVRFRLKFPLKDKEDAATAQSLAQKTKVERVGRRKGVETIVSPEPSEKHRKNREAIAQSLDEAAGDITLNDDKIPY